MVYLVYGKLAFPSKAIAFRHRCRCDFCGWRDIRFQTTARRISRESSNSSLLVYQEY
jgi:hypothetical protein